LKEAPLSKKGSFVDKIRAIIADDHAVLRLGVRKILEGSGEVEVVGEAKNGVEALQLLNEVEADVLILDIEMPVMGGIDVIRVLFNTHTPIRTLILSAYDDLEYITQVFKHGANGYLLKDDVPSQLLRAIRGVFNGEKRWMSKQIAAKMAARV
jgi:DNA-binding NarL/FixJ family response regulator